VHLVFGNNFSESTRLTPETRYSSRGQKPEPWTQSKTRIAKTIPRNTAAREAVAPVENGYGLDLIQTYLLLLRILSDGEAALSGFLFILQFY